MLKSCTSITTHNTGSDGWEKGDGRLGWRSRGAPTLSPSARKDGAPGETWAARPLIAIKLR
jgi:hypothetical protein